MRDHKNVIYWEKEVSGGKRMKKQPIRRFAVLLFVGVAVCCGIHFAMPVPDTAEVEIYDSFVSGKYDEIKMRMEEI